MKIDTAELLDLVNILSSVLTNLSAIEHDPIKQSYLIDMVNALDNFIEGAIER